MRKHNLRILLVEDHPFQLVALQIQLNNQGFYLLTPVLNAGEAMAALERSVEPYDLLLCDQCLPDLCGSDLIEYASRKGTIRHAVLLSGLAEDRFAAIKQRALERRLPLLGCLSKPLHGQDLARLLAQIPRATQPDSQS